MFQSRTSWEVWNFSYATKVPFEFDSSFVSCLIKEWKGIPGGASKHENDNAEDGHKVTSHVIADTHEAKVHAEAALMYYIAAFKVRC